MNPALFGELFQQTHERLVCTLSISMRNPTEAEEIAAMSYARAYKKRETFRGDSSFYTWIYAIAKNEIRTRHRHPKPVPIEQTNETQWERQDVDGIDAQLERSQSKRALRGCLRAISSKYRRALILRYFCELSIKDIGRYEDIAIGTVLSRLHKGKTILRGFWRAQNVKAA